MPILSNLSRRFSLLTSDAKPDPPRVNIPDNLSTTNSSGVSSTSSDVGIAQDNEENSTPGSESKFFNLETDKGRKPNFYTKKNTQSDQTKNVINYNIVNSCGVKIGETITYVCNINQCSKNEEKTDENNSTSTKPMNEAVKMLSMSKEELTMKEMFLIKTHIDSSWREIFKSLGYSKGQLDQFEENYKSKGLDEMIYQILLDWKRENGRAACIGTVVKVLWENHQYDCVQRLVAANTES